MNIVLRMLMLFQRKDEEEVQTLQEQGWEPRRSNSAQHLLQGTSRVVTEATTAPGQATLSACVAWAWEESESPLLSGQHILQ